MSHENDLYVFQCDVKEAESPTILTIVFVRKNPKIISKCEHVKSMFEDEFFQFSFIGDDQFQDEIRYFIRQPNIEEIHADSDIGKKWIKSAQKWLHSVMYS